MLWPLRRRTRKPATAPGRGQAIQTAEQRAARQRLYQLARTRTAEYRYERPAR